MTTLTVTKTTGGKTRPMLMTVAAPAQSILPHVLQQFATGSGLNGAAFADLLSAFTAHERCGAHLYRCVAGRTSNPQLKQQYEEFGRETTEHIQIYEDLISKLGGDPNYVSPQARMTEFSDTKLMENVLLTGSVDRKTEDLVSLECVLIAESKCHSNWQFLSQLAKQLPGGKTKQALQQAVDRVEQQEDQHLNWAKSTWQRLQMELLQR